jgi:thiol:disulfide interchange protein DsbD
MRLFSAAGISHVRRALFSLAALVSSACFGQQLDPVQWSLSSDVQRVRPGDLIAFQLTATIEPRWHLYSLTTPKGGPIPTTAALKGGAIQSAAFYQPAPDRRFDQNFNLDTETFADKVPLLVSGVVPVGTTDGDVDVTTEVRYQACSDRQCLPPRKKTASLTILVDAAAPAQPKVQIPAGYTLVASPETPVPQIPNATPASQPQAAVALFLLTAFGLGFAAVFTPCVFPMIPITVSFFLNRRGGIVQAATFATGIVFLFCGLGLGVTALTGPFGVVRLGANPWINGFIATVFGLFAISLLGAFEMALPSGLLTSLDRVSRREGYLGTLFMGLTFALTSFACVGPFVGSLLAASVQTPGSRTLLGMVSFSAGLSSPFFFLAAFPSYLKRLPRSGQWMMRVKVVMGFVLLAAMLKYLNNVDQVLQLGVLSRERILAAWLVLFSLAGFYLLGLLRLGGVSCDERLGVGRLVVASLLLTFACSLASGISGSGLGELEAWLPAPRPNAELSRSGESLTWLKNQYQEALETAHEQNKSVLVNFTGYACTNCHWMKANMFTQLEVASEMRNFVLLDLYTDGSDAASVRNQEIQSTKYGTIAIPFYAIVDPDGNTVTTFPGLTRDATEWLAFLKRGILRAGDFGARRPFQLAAITRLAKEVEE